MGTPCESAAGHFFSLKLIYCLGVDAMVGRWKTPKVRVLNKKEGDSHDLPVKTGPLLSLFQLLR